MSNLRFTKQKAILNRQLGQMEGLFTADQFYDQVSKINSKIGIATVYRFLKNSKSSVHSFQCGRKTIYSVTNRAHSHLICEKCGKTEHITLKKLDFLKEIKDSKVCHVQIDLHGVCSDCLKAK